MPQAVFHVLSGLIVADVIRDFVFRKKYFPLYLVLIAGIAALLPDFDVLLYWIAETFASADYMIFHRTYTHSLLFLVLFILPAIAFHFSKKRKARNIFLMISLGVLLHLLFDAIFQGSIMPLYPFSSFELGLNLFGSHLGGTMAQGVDAILLVLWLVYLEMRHRISDFI